MPWNRKATVRFGSIWFQVMPVPWSSNLFGYNSRFGWFLGLPPVPKMGEGVFFEHPSDLMTTPEERTSMGSYAAEEEKKKLRPP